MNHLKYAKISLGVAVLFLSACEPATVSPSISPNLESTVKIMEDEHTNVAILLNEGGGMSVVNIGTGQKFVDCKRHAQAEHKTAGKVPKECRPINTVKILGEREIKLTITEGSPLCLDIASVVGQQAACSPPLGELDEAFIRSFLAQ